MNEMGHLNKRIALFGGKFDPPHLGHQITIFLALEKFLMNEVWVIPTFSHPFEFNSSSFELRCQMANILIKPWEKQNRAVVSQVEKELGTEKVFTIDVIKLLQKKHPDYKFYLFIGGDNWKARNKWKDFDEIEKICEGIVVVGRGNDIFADFSLPDISSSQIRKMIQNGKNPSALLPKGVWEFILKTDCF